MNLKVLWILQLMKMLYGLFFYNSLKYFFKVLFHYKGNNNLSVAKLDINNLTVYEIWNISTVILNKTILIYFFLFLD